MDQTQEILNNHLIYGASDSTNQNATSVGKLNFAHGGSMQHAWPIDIVNVKTVLHWKDDIGLAGAENHFVKVNLKLGDYPGTPCYEEIFWECAEFHNVPEKDHQWEGVIVDHNKDLIEDAPVGTYWPAEWNTPRFPNYGQSTWISVRVEDLSTGNTHNDKWFDTRLYTKEKFEHPYELMYVKKNEFFYIGFHARNTRRIAYNVKIHIGEFWVPYEGIRDKRFVRRLTKYGNYSG